jgi:SAM-dependent methyltransferase
VSEVFGAVYAHAYDLLYGDKDYAAECKSLVSIFDNYGAGQIRTILDLGCGTGNHAIPLAQQGYQVVGVDRSGEMLAHAQDKATLMPEKGRLALLQGDIRDFHLQQRFDAVLMMFAVLGYQIENADVLAALRTAHRHLRAGGLLIFDVWYGPAVLHVRPSQRLKVIPTADGQILRATWAELDITKHLCTVHYKLWQLAGERLVAESEENHIMRYFFPQELVLFLECAGFTLVRVGAFPALCHPADERTWNVLVAAQPI